MSRKVQQFTKNVPYPQNVHNFTVLIPDLLENGVDLNLIVESSSFPSYKFRTITLWTHGEPVEYPGLPDGTRTWSVSVPENDKGSVYEIIRSLYKELYNEQTGTLYTPKYRDVQVFARDTQDNIVFHCILHGAWFEGRDIVNLTNSDPTQVWKWPLSFHFHWIENPESAGLEGSTDPFSA